MEQTFAAAALAVYNENITDVKSLKAALAKVTISDSEFKDSFARARSSKADLARYYLRALEAVKTNESEPWYVPNEDKDAITLEHILPRNPEDGTWELFNDEERAAYHKRLGNLCLLQKSVNSKKDNTSFAAGKQIYANSPYYLTRQVAEYPEWTPAAVDDRQRQMAELAVKAWPI